MNEDDQYTDKINARITEKFGDLNVDSSIKAAVSAWDKFVSAYPEKMVDKNFLKHNTGLVRSLVNAVVPEVMRENVELETELVELESLFYDMQTTRLIELTSMASVLTITVSPITTAEDLESVQEKLSSYGDTIDFGDLSSEDNETCSEEPTLVSPLWLFCAVFPTEALAPMVLAHDKYTQFVYSNKNVKQVSLEDSPLFSGPSSDILRELGLE